MGTTFPTLPRFSAEEMKKQAAKSMALAAAQLEADRRALYQTALAEVRVCVESLISESGDLRHLRSVRSQSAKVAMRYMLVPFISADNLKLLSAAERSDIEGWDEATRPERATMYVEANTPPTLFPWLTDERDPTQEELRVASEFLVTSMATERMQTLKRTKDGKSQESVVREAAPNYTPVAGVGSIQSLSDLDPGSCTAGEVPVGPEGAQHKADHVLRTASKLVCVEAKRSGSVTNSFKRVVTECENKTTVWSEHFGNDVVVVAFIGGAISAAQALRIQEKGAYVVWDHDVAAYKDWLAAVRNL